MTLPPFTGDQAVCTKCGHEGAHTNYEYEGLGRTGEGTPATRYGERLDRSCRRCGYTWPEATQDSGERT